MFSTARVRVTLTAFVVAFGTAGCGDETLTPSSGDGELLRTAEARSFSGWSPAMDIEAALPGAHENFNTPALEGCPFISRDGKSFYIASDRDGGEGGIDIWVSTRAHVNDPWGEPVNVGPPVNSVANDFCPTIARDGHTFYFVSTREVTEVTKCRGGGDIYVTRLRNGKGFEEPTHLGCPVNSPDNEFSPFPMPQSTTGPVLYFSRLDAGDIYMAESHGGAFGTPQVVAELSSPAVDGHPNVRRDGLELFFFSSRGDLPGAQGGNDIHSATRASTSDPWSTPVNLGSAVNSAASETRPSLSWDGTRLYVGSSREGSSDIYVSTREAVVR